MRRDQARIAEWRERARIDDVESHEKPPVPMMTERARRNLNSKLRNADIVEWRKRIGFPPLK